MQLSVQLRPQIARSNSTVASKATSSSKSFNSNSQVPHCLPRLGPLLLCFLLFIAGLHITRSYERQSRAQILPPCGPRILNLSRFQSAVLQGSPEGLLRGRSVVEVATVLLWGGGENEDVPPVLGSRTEEKLAAFPGWAGEISQRTAAESEVGVLRPSTTGLAGPWLSSGFTPTLDSISERPSITIFSAPEPYTESSDDPQRRALLSWLALSPEVHIHLLGKHPSLTQLAAQFPGRVGVDSLMDYTFRGLPLFNALLARARIATSDIAMVLEADVILLPDLLLALAKVHGRMDSWILSGGAWHVPVWDRHLDRDLAAAVDPTKDTHTREVARENLRTAVRAVGRVHLLGDPHWWAWNTSPLPLVGVGVPPFVVGQGGYGSWLQNEMVEGGVRHVVDASDVVTALRVREGGGEGRRWRQAGGWEAHVNGHLAMAQGRYEIGKGSPLAATWHLTTCEEVKANNMCLLRRFRPGVCACAASPYFHSTETDSLRLMGSRAGSYSCGAPPPRVHPKYEIRATPSKDSPTGLPLAKAAVLEGAALKVGELKIVTLVAVTIGYADMLMSFFCRLRTLGLDGTVVVAAMDEEMYTFAFTQGLPVYYEGGPGQSRSSEKCDYGTECFKQFTKLKSRLVLSVLRDGYSVLWTDVDIVWFKNPLPDLLSHGRGTFPVQSNEPDNRRPANGKRRINSGFYLARSDAKTIEAFEEIVAHAATTNMTEQPSFYDVLCGPGGEGRIGKSECRFRNGLRTVFLDRKTYPNGAIYGMWKQPDVAGACKVRKCTILHNNWIEGKEKKRERMVKHGFWHFDSYNRMCMYKWHVELRVMAGEDAKRAFSLVANG